MTGTRAPDALAEPTVPVRPGWISLLFGANLGLWLGIYPPIQVLLPEQAEHLDAAHKELVFGIVTGVGAVVSPRRHPDFAWAWGCHFLINLGNALGTFFLLFFLTDAVHHPDPDTGLLIMMARCGVALVIGGLVVGPLSDRTGRRKPFVLGAVVVMAAAAVVLVLWQTWPAALAASPLLGVGFGAYWAVALAILTEVLPAAQDRAKDLGVINIANALPQVIAPVAATVILAELGGYPGLFAASAVATLAAGTLILAARSVR